MREHDRLHSPDPLDVISTYGADALRFTVLFIAPVGQDVLYDNEKCEIGRNFANKIWNAMRFRMRQGDLSPDWHGWCWIRRTASWPCSTWR